MGDRSSIYIKSDDNLDQWLHLYGHWSGDSNTKAVAEVLRKTDRIGDMAYLTAQIFYEFSVYLGSYTGSLGFGIDICNTTPAEWFDDNPPVIVNADTGDVEWRNENYTRTEFVNLIIGETNG